MEDTALAGGNRTQASPEPERPREASGPVLAAAHARTEDGPPVHELLDQERVYRAIELLRDNAQAPAAVAELVRRGTTVIPDLLDAMERRDAELRRRVFMVVQHICGPGLAFDPQAPEAHAFSNWPIYDGDFSATRPQADFSRKPVAPRG